MKRTEDEIEAFQSRRIHVAFSLGTEIHLNRAKHAKGRFLIRFIP
jgi:hypothetical protein